jgi:DNA-directed RNA polymerase sigma subunit (sigma70/sigma32)
MFQKGNPTAEALTPKKQNELLILLLESLEPREAEVVMGIFGKDQGVPGLTYKFVKEAFPNMLP